MLPPPIEIVHSEETKLFACDHCNRKDAEIYNQNTAYANDWSNYVVLCEDCQRESDEHWQGMWDEYYRGCL